MAKFSEDVRRTIERGLEHYRCGELREAIAEWDKALVLEPQNVQAQDLLVHAQEMLPPDDPSRRADHLSIWPLDEKTEPESQIETRDRVLRAESEAAAVVRAQAELAEGARRGRMTIESPISAFLAPLTSPDWSPPASEDGAPAAQVQDDISAVHKPRVKIASGVTPVFSDTLRDEPSRVGRLRASEMIERCRTEFDNGQWEEAAGAAAGAVAEAERLGPGALAELLDPARPLFEQAFAAQIGPLHRVPVSLVSSDDAQVSTLGANAQGVCGAVDGVANLGQILASSSLPRFDCLCALSVLLHQKLIKLM